MYVGYHRSDLRLPKYVHMCCRFSCPQHASLGINSLLAPILRLRHRLRRRRRRRHRSYYVLSKKGGYAYGFYAASFVLLPNLVTAVVLFYGGQLVMQGQVTGGKVVSFMIYLTSLSDGFNDMASIFSSMCVPVYLMASAYVCLGHV